MFLKKNTNMHGHVQVTSKKAKCLKAKKTHGFNSCIVISVYPLDIMLIKKGYRISL